MDVLAAALEEDPRELLLQNRGRSVPLAAGERDHVVLHGWIRQ